MANTGWIALVVGGVMGVGTVVAGQERRPPPPSPPPPGPALTPPKTSAQAVIDPETGRVRIGQVVVDPAARQARFPCRVNMAKGLLEYALVGGQGKLHESLLRTDVEPYDLQVALLLLGLEGGQPLGYQGDPAPPKGDPVEVWVEWGAPPDLKKVRLESWIRDERTRAPMAETDWVFTGSMVSNGVFLAQVERSIVAVYHDPAAMIDNPLPGGGDDTVWFVREGVVPAEGTEVWVSIRPGG